MNILYVCSEAAPLVKTGGLADVAQSLPRALRDAGHDVRVAMPCYGMIPEAARGVPCATCVANIEGHAIFGAMHQSVFPGNHVPLYLIEHEAYFDRPHAYGPPGESYTDNLERFSFFCLGLLDAIPLTGWKPDVVHCHDWHTAAIPALIATRYTLDPMWRGMPTVFTIHNLAYQGSFPASLMPRSGLAWELFRPDYAESHGELNLMKAALAFSTKLNTVSPRYAREIQQPDWGHGLDASLRARTADLAGILNGIDYDVWNPGTDPYIVANFDRDDLAGKPVCKHALQHRMHLSSTDAPLFGMVSRLVEDKGIDLLIPALRRLLDRDVQVVVLGTGDAQYEEDLAELVRMHPGRMRAVVGYDEDLAHQIYAGSDFYLMPSRREPCGLSQLYALAYGAVPIVRATGGLADTVVDVSPGATGVGDATGIQFEAMSESAVTDALNRALDFYDDPDCVRALRQNGMQQGFSWKRSCEDYVQLYKSAIDRERAAGGVGEQRQP
ncbi:MAG: glycogen synthase GlgA [bacterium]|nr:glycogen synthase GlgA [bacterium]